MTHSEEQRITALEVDVKRLKDGNGGGGCAMLVFIVFYFVIMGYLEYRTHTFQRRIENYIREVVKNTPR